MTDQQRLADAPESKKPKAQKKSSKWMTGQKPITTKTFAAVIAKGYHTGLSSGPELWSSAGPVTGVVAKMSVLRPCTSAACDKEEAVPKEFKSCNKCHTVYCSPECSKFDWKHGEHKARCTAYSEEQQREVERYADCPTCSANVHKRDFACCFKCLFKPARES